MITKARESWGVDAEAPALDLDRLAAMSVGELDALYAGGRAPASVSALRGRPDSRMLTPVGPLGRGRPAALVQRLARWSRFPWAGKAFEPLDEDRGQGINRIRLDREREWFPFEYRLETSAVDGRPCVVLDYERDENPWFIRAIHDEVREVAPGLYLGPAMAKLPGRRALVVYFALSFS